ncbi:unnamed protein product [Microthlaspi erraticum]|uniref:Protein kinase domain-containing protein n=1 Tax=Microthlaspi erraticum TaxID=1685480 RepID=A0A6D2L5X3_9BRAS|nr:unnamed protein product [Microthlaspi erraticum]
MYYLPTSCLVFFFLFPLFHHLACASSNTTSGFTSWGENRNKSCDHPLLEFHCNKNITSLSISNQDFSVIQINQTSNTLTLARTDHLGSFCSSNFTNTTLPPETFELPATYKSVTVFYSCNNFRLHLSRFRCPVIGLISVSEDPNQYYDFCLDSFIVNVPTNFVTKEKELNMTDLERVLRNGFEVKVKIDENEICGFNEILPLGLNCGLLHPTTGLSAEAKTSSHQSPFLPANQTRIVENEHNNFFISRGAAFASGLVVVILAAGGLFCVIFCLRKTSDGLRQKNLKALIPLKHYSYAQVKKITKSFAEVVGKGGFGTVYRGTLSDGRSVAVKVLKDSKGNGEDFINEVASMSKTSHVNIVSLLGFCSQGSKRAIIYEFVENGSLDKFISSNNSMNMDWIAMYGIALGVSRGLEYLHYGCKTRIVHFDIKPQNVMLDGNLCPKVSDFGLAKLCEKKESTMSLLDTRGTVGNIAPEMISRVYGSVSHKSDVYSYGMLVLEMIGARNNISKEQSASNASSMYFPEWIYKDLEKRDNGRNGISSEEEDTAKKMPLVGLWCVQSSPSDRPAMNRVVEMMEGSVDALEVPPRPVFQILPAPRQDSSFTLSEDISVHTEVCSMNGV